MEMVTVPVSVRGSAGSSRGAGALQVGHPTLPERLKRAGILVGVGLIAAVGFLPIPIIHLFGIMFLLAMIGVSLRRLGIREVVRSASGRCPACDRDGTFFVGLGWRPYRMPISTSCPHCAIGLTLEAEPV